MASPILDAYRQRVPAAQNLSDEALAEELRANFYPDADPEVFKANVGVTREIGDRPIDQYRAQVPASWGLSDSELVTELHSRFGGDKPLGDYARDFGVEDFYGVDQSGSQTASAAPEQSIPSDFSELPDVNQPLQSDRADARADQDRMTIGEAGEALWRNIRGVPSALEAGAAMGFGSSAEGTGLIAEQFSNTEYSRRVDNAIKNLNTVQENYAQAIEGVEDPERRAAIEQNFNELIADREADLQQAVDDWKDREPNQAAEFFRGIGNELQSYAQSRLEEGPAAQMNPIARDLSTGTGSFLTYIGPGVATNLLTRNAPRLTRELATYTTSLGLASTQGVSDQYQRAINAGLSEEEAVERSIGGIPGGAVQVAPIASILRPLPAEIRGKALGQLVTILRTAGSEALAESSGVILQNLVERSYNPEQGVWDDSLYNAAIGGGVGGIVQLGIQLSTRGRGIGGTTETQSEDPLDGIEIRGPETQTPGSPSARPQQISGVVIDPPAPTEAIEENVPEEPAPDQPDPESFEAIDREVEQIRRDVIVPARDPEAVSPSEEAISEAQQQIDDLLERREQLVTDTQAADAPVSAEPLDVLPQQTGESETTAPATDSVAPQGTQPEVSDLQTSIENNQRQIDARREELLASGVPDDQIEIDPTLRQLEMVNQEASRALSRLQQRSVEAEANQVIDRGRAPSNDALGQQIERTRDESDQGIRQEIQRLREISSARPVEPQQPSDPTADDAPESEVTPLQQQARALRERGRISEIDAPNVTALDTGTDAAQGEPGDVAVSDTNVTQMRNPVDDARYERNQLSREMAYQMENLLRLQVEDSPFNRSRIARTQRTIDDLNSQIAALEAQYPEIAGAEIRRFQEEQERGFEVPDNLREVIDGIIEDFGGQELVDELTFNFEETGSVSPQDEIDRLFEVISYGVSETMGGDRPNSFEQEIIRQRATEAVTQALQESGLDQQVDMESIALQNQPGSATEAPAVSAPVSDQAVSAEDNVVSIFGDPAEGPETPATLLGDSDAVAVGQESRPSVNNTGRQIHPTREGVRNFWRWFGDGKAADEQGRPVVLYHGSATGGIEVFDTYGSNYGLMGQGSYFTDDPSIASQYSRQGRIRNQEPTVYPAYVSISNPIDMDAPADIDAFLQAYSPMVDGLERSDFNDAQTNEDAYRVVEDALISEGVPDYEGAEIMQDGLRNMGYDGITHIGGGRVQADGPRHRVWIAFDPEQVKSAVGNTGSFDSSDPRIAFSRRAPVGGGLGVEEAFSYVDGLMSDWANAPALRVIQNEDGLPEVTRNRVDEIGARGEIRGVILNGEIYVLAANNSSRAEVEETIFHEVVRHWGIRQVLGDNYNDFMDKVYLKVGRSAIQPFADYNGLDLDANDAAKRARNRRLAAEELLAHTTEEQLGSRLWTRLVNLVTEWLRRMGFRIQLTGHEIRDVIQRAKMYVQDGEFVSGASVVRKHEVYYGADHSQATEDALYARSLKPEEAINQRAEVRRPRGENYVGVRPEFTIRNPFRKAPSRSLILSSTNENNADVQSAALDVLIEKHQEPLSSERAWAAYANDAFGLNRVPMPPFRTIGLVNEGPEAIVREISRLSDGMQKDAEAGLKTAQEFGRVYKAGQATPDITGKAFLWSFLSRGVSPYVQESAFLDAIMSDELTSIMRRAAKDGWSAELETAYDNWAANAIPVGSPGRGTQHNLNAFGRNFLRVMSQRHPDADNKTGLEIIHEMIANGDPSYLIRREFLKRGSGAGIDNKVVSFTLLLLGRTDVLVLDRVQIRNQFNDGRFDGQNIYDIKKDENGKQIAGSGFAEMTFGHKGLLYYEAMERALKPIVEQAYSDMGMEGSLGRYHWDSWLLASNQEVGHASTEGLLREAQGLDSPYSGAFVRQGKYGNYDYGFRYGVIGNEGPVTLVEKLDGSGAVILPREIVADSTSPTRKTLSRLSNKAKKRDNEAGKSKPWTAVLTTDERAEYDRAIESGGTPAPDLWAYDPDAVRREGDAGAETLDNGGAQRRRDTGESSLTGDVVGVARRNERRFEPVDGDSFLSAMQRAGQSIGPIAAQVSVVDPSSNVQRFLLDDGLSGYAIDGDNLIGVFKDASAPPGTAQRIVEDAVFRGARRLDGFNTMLPKVYARAGFRAVARLPFNPQFAPRKPEALENWDAEAMESIRPGWGAPDVVFMVYDPVNASADTDNIVSSYDEGVAAQYREMPDEPLFSRRSDDPDLDEARERAGLGGRRRPLADFIRNLQAVSHSKARDMTLELRHAVAQGAFDRFHGIKRVEQNTVGPIAAEQSAYVAARLSTGIATTMRAILHHGTPQWENGIISRIPNSKGLLEILEPVRGDIDTFLGWMVARRAARLYTEGRENLFEPRHINALLDAGEASPRFDQFEAVAAELDFFKGAVLDIAEQAGLIDPDARAAWDQSDYIPFYRIADDSPSATGPSRRRALSGQTSGIRTLRGGVDRLNDPLENLIMNFTHLMDASMKNAAILRLRDNVNEFEGILEEVGPDFTAEMIPMEQVRKQLIRSGADPSVIPAEAMQGLAKMWAMKPPAEDDVIRVMDGGKARYYRVLDPMLLKSLTAVHDAGLQGLPLDFMRWMKRILTRGVTADPAFIARNYIRDMMHAWTISEDKFRLGVDSVRGAAKTIRETGGTIDMMFAGGSFLGGYVNATDPREVARATRQALRQRGYTAASANQFISTIIDSPLKAWEFYTRFGDSIENASREAVYEAAIREGRSRAEAVFMAKDLMDYSMRGSNPAMQFLTDVVPFLNARLQGLYKLGRAGIDNPGSILARGSMIMFATLALYYDNKDDERYEQLEDWDKDTYWHFFPPEGIPGLPDHIRIPKPFEVGVLFGTIPERIAANALGNEDGEKTYDRMLWAIHSTFAFNPIPQAAFPVIEVFANRNVFTGAPIENMSDQSRLPEARYSPYTSETMQALGQYTGPTLGLSPKELQHLWRGYTGTLGMYALDMADMISRRVQGKPPRPSMRIDRMPVVGAFIRAEPAMRTQFQTDLYDLFNEARQIQRTIDAYVEEGDVEKAMSLANESPKMIAALPSMRDTTRDLGRIRDQVTQIYQSEDMTPEEKREAIDELIAVRNEITRTQVKALEEFFDEDPLTEEQE